MKSCDIRDVPTFGVETYAALGATPFLMYRISFRIDTVLDYLDLAADETVSLCQTSRTEGADGGDFVDEAIEHETVRQAAFGRHNVRVMTAVFGEDHLHGL